MAAPFQVSKSNPPLTSLIVIEVIKNHFSIEVEWSKETKFDAGNSLILTKDITIARHLIRCVPQLLNSFYGSEILSRTEVDSWLTLASGPLSSVLLEQFLPVFKHLNNVLAPATYLVGHSISLADFAVFSALNQNKVWREFLTTKDAASTKTENVSRWYEFIGSQAFIKAVLSRIPLLPISPKVGHTKKVLNNGAKKDGIKDEGKYIELPGADMGKVVVRFPPEASGYLHIGHAKAALLNQHYRLLFDGKLILRFDDTNPAKEKEVFERVILDDLKLLGISYDFFSRTSDHFETMIAYAGKLIKIGLAYVDNTDSETMKIQREKRVESDCRSKSVAENLDAWEAMKQGSEYGRKCVLRAKIDMGANNGCMRDPVIYRCKEEPHPATGNTHKVYPTYDFACPIVDSVEGVTHALRTTEYTDRDDQYLWFLEVLGLRKPYIWSYARLNLTNTVMSKRKLTWLVDNNFVDGWDDPRLPTVRGILRRGLTVEALQQFIVAQGSSRSVVFMEWDKIWAINRKIIDPISPRYTSIDAKDKVTVLVRDVSADAVAIEKVDLHPKNPELGVKSVWRCNRVIIDRVDAQAMKMDSVVTFVNWGNFVIEKIDLDGAGIVARTDLENRDFKKTLKVTWLPHPSISLIESTASLTPTVCVFYDYLITKDVLEKTDDFKNFLCRPELSMYKMSMLGDPQLKVLKRGDIIQLQRRGFFIVDDPFQAVSPNTCCVSPVRLISIPDGTPGSYGPPAFVKQHKPNDVVNKLPVSQVITPCVSAASVQLQADKVRTMKKNNVAKKILETEIQILLDLKKNFKNANGFDWKADMDDINDDTRKLQPTSEIEINDKIKKQGDKIRELKSAKLPFNDELDVLKSLKSDYKNITGRDWTATGGINPSPSSNENLKHLEAEILQQGNKVRDLKSKSDQLTSDDQKEALKTSIAVLLDLKKKFKNATGREWKPPVTSQNVGSKTKLKKTCDNEVSISVDTASQKKQTRLCIEVRKTENFSEWYSQIIIKSEMLEYYDVSGCYILRPWSYSIWERIQMFVDAQIKLLGVENTYFPIFVSAASLQREKDHIADFAPEVAWVTRSGDTEMAEPIAIRPTSETIMYPTFAKWVQSHRDLPLKFNQWNNVVRWEFKHPQPFLRTREFLWQEGHTAFATLKEAKEEVILILDIYRQVYEDLLAVPVVRGRKTEKEKFAGGDYTYTAEAYISASGRAIQGATSHHLGQNFSRMFDIAFVDPDSGTKRYVYQNSWGITTRTIGVLVMVHGDDQGLVLPPRIAQIQVVIIPCGVSAGQNEELYSACRNVQTILGERFRCRVDLRDNVSPGWKFNHWELKGVPLRLELGPKDIKSCTCVLVRRDTGFKKTYQLNSIVESVDELLVTIQADMFKRAKQQLANNIVVVTEWKEFLEAIEQNKLIQAPFCGDVACEELIKEQSKSNREELDFGVSSMGAKSLCMPFDQPAKLNKDEKCIGPNCKLEPQAYTMFGKSY